jgi:hypothetical protein
MCIRCLNTGSVVVTQCTRVVCETSVRGGRVCLCPEIYSQRVLFVTLTMITAVWRLGLSPLLRFSSKENALDMLLDNDLKDLWE